MPLQQGRRDRRSAQLSSIQPIFSSPPDIDDDELVPSKKIPPWKKQRENEIHIPAPIGYCALVLRENDKYIPLVVVAWKKSDGSYAAEYGKGEKKRTWELSGDEIMESEQDAIALAKRQADYANRINDASHQEKRESWIVTP